MATFKKILICFVCMVLIVCVCVAGSREALQTTSTDISESPTKIIIDAGHGGLTNTIN